VINNLDEWRKELREIDVELVSLLRRRAELAIELLQRLSRKDLTLGDLDKDTLRLSLLLWSQQQGAFPPLDDMAVKKIFRRIITETRRLAYSHSTAGVSTAEASLTPRERQILILIAEDYSLKDIALKLSISVKTVESHKAAVMKKLNIYSIVGLTRYAIKKGLVDM
jgi:DNA-binding NarL/FixJ family response regulator